MGLFTKKSPKDPNEQTNKTTENPVAVKETKKPKKEKAPAKRGKDFATKKVSEKSAIATQFGIRISNPYGYFPEDVDRVLEDLQSQLNTLSKENKFASEKLARIQKERDDAKTELSKLKMQVSLMEVPDTSAEEDFQMMSRLSSINPVVGNLADDVPDQSKFTGKIEPVIADKIEVDDEPEEEKQSGQETFDNLVRKAPKKPKQTVSLKTPQKETKPQRQAKTKFDLEILGGEDE